MWGTEAQVVPIIKLKEAVVTTSKELNLHGPSLNPSFNMVFPLLFVAGKKLFRLQFSKIAF